MNPLRRMLSALSRKSELQDELQSHLNLAIADRVARGESPETARREALRDFGNVPLIADVTREGWGWLWLEHFAQDFKYAVRQLSKSPGFAITAILTLALCIGANLAVFSLIYAIMMRSLPVPHPEQIVQLQMRTDGVSPYDSQMTSMYNVIAAHQKPLSGMCGVMWDGMLMSGEGDPKRVSAADVTGDCFQTLQIIPALGRLLTPEDDIEGGGPKGFATVLSYDYWRNHFHGDPKAIGQVISVKNLLSMTKPLVIVGVLPKDFHGLVVGRSAAIYLPSYVEGKENRDSYGNETMFVFGRMKPGMTRMQAERELQPAFANWRESMPPVERGDAKVDLQKHDLGVYDARIGSSEMAAEFGKELWFLQLLVGLILVAGCVYLSTLLSARTVGRRQELALRFALGAGRSRIAAQLLVETLVLIVSGTAAGLFLGWGAARILVTYIPRWGSAVELDLRPTPGLFAFAVGVACFSALLTGLAPAIRGSNADLIGDMRLGKGAMGGWRSHGVGGVMLPLQIAFSVIFVVLAGLLSASLVRTLSQNNGFRLSGTVFAQTTIPTVMTEKGDKDQAKLKAQFAQYRDLVERLSRAPGVDSASLSVTRPLSGAGYTSVFKTVGEKEVVSDQGILENWVAGRYFETVGTRLLKGHEFAAHDGHSGLRVCILSASAARYFFPNGEAVGKALEGIGNREPVTVVGVAEDTRWNTLQSEMPRMIYLPIEQQEGWTQSLDFVMRTEDSNTALGSLRRILREEAGAQIVDVVTIRDAVDRSLGMPRLLATLSNALAGLALLLSAVAIYGLLSYSVRQRNAEIAVRMAVGASRTDVVRMVARQAVWLVVPGLLLGGLGAGG